MIVADGPFSFVSGEPFPDGGGGNIVASTVLQEGFAENYNDSDRDFVFVDLGTPPEAPPYGAKVIYEYTDIDGNGRPQSEYAADDLYIYGGIQYIQVSTDSQTVALTAGAPGGRQDGANPYDPPIVSPSDLGYD